MKRRVGDKLSPEDWPRVKAVFEGALPLEASERAEPERRGTLIARRSGPAAGTLEWNVDPATPGGDGLLRLLTGRGRVA